MDQLKFPIGRFEAPSIISKADRDLYVQAIEELPAQLRESVDGLSDGQLDTAYREGGWSVRQVVHHLADSHANNYARIRFALTEENPAIKPYDEAKWAELPDARSFRLESSLKMVEGIHERWTALMRSFTEADWKRTFYHPERGVVALDETMALYAWHGRHHVAHIRNLRQRKNW
jgi:uncharacterized damage-inducible protein DinB